MELGDARAEIDSYLSWWTDAGVDTVIDELPQNWLSNGDVGDDGAVPRAPVPASAETPSPVHAVAPSIDIGALPTLEAFRSWFATDATVLGAYPARRRVMPGPVASDLMILADMPETSDVEAGSLLSGDVGAQLDRMLAALGRSRDSVYLATMAPARPPTGQLGAPDEAILAPIAVRHIALAAPKRLWLLGRAASRAVLGMDEIEAGGRLHCVNYGDTTMDVIATVHPRILMRSPQFKARVWKDMQRLMEEPTA